MMVNKKSSQRLGDHVYEAIIAMIDTQKLVEGTRLPTEIELAAQFGVSRPIVRETLARLRNEGLVVSRRGSGSYIGSREASVNSLEFSELCSINSFEQIRKCYEFRAVLEGEACFLAAINRTAAQLQIIEDSCSLLGQAVENRNLGSDIDFEFHASLAKASGNDWYLSMLVAMRQQIQLVIDIARRLSLNRPAEYMNTVQSEHEAIFKAVMQQRPDQARAAMHAHLSNTIGRIFKGPQS
jgi:GntR family transcriptional repressor for pyruvate dehydrogenase complex